jgi:glucose/arabinose dehydrogenase
LAIRSDLALWLACLAACSDVTAATRVPLGTTVVARGLETPVFLTSPAGDPRLFVLEKSGRIRIIEGGRLQPQPFLDLSREVSGAMEQGLLGLAFHPAYRENGFFYVNYTDTEGDTRIVRYKVSANPNAADKGSAKLILTVDQPYANHNGGMVLFGPDGMLYVGMGDGGAGGDPHGNGQDRGTLLGDLLRLDVDHGDPYAIPKDNPWPNTPGVRPEIWAYGLRNPWRFAFDVPSGKLYIADVGQNELEEINVVPMRAAGLNYGWNLMEGSRCYGEHDCKKATGLTLPVVEYTHADGCSVTGGYVYRGRAIPKLVGHYLYSDFCKGWLRSFRDLDGRTSEEREYAVPNLGPVTSFGEDAKQELYVLSANGLVYRLTP